MTSDSTAITAPREQAAVRRSLAPATRFVYIAAAIWFALFAIYGVARHFAFATARFDLGNMTQALWSTAHGRFLEDTTLSGAQASRLAGHVDPLLALLTPLWWLWSSPFLLVTISALALATGALPVFWLARKHLGSERAGFEFALIYLLCPMTQWNSIWDFHPVSLAIPLILFAIWFLDEDRLAMFALFALLASASKEEIPLAVGCLGIWYAVSHGRRLAGAAIFAVGAVLTAFDFLVVIPHFAVAGENAFAGRYSAVGGTPSGILRTAVTHPLRILEAAFSGHNIGYLVLLTVLLGGLFFAAPLLALGAIPDLVINVLSNDSNQTSLQFQYTAGIMPFLLAAAIFGAARLRRRLPAAPAVVLALALLGCLFFGPLSTFPRTVRAAMPSNPDRLAKAGAVGMIPPGVAVSASNHLAAHLSARRHIYVFPVVREARWVVVDPRDETHRRVKAFQPAIRRLKRNPGWQVVYDLRGVLVFERR
jgi:uncharacterized membrane protein